ncbi:MAG TPA: hypothetical protein VJO13_01695 [Ktedonobacterales bacterium]|nr:hypothetical protein [Ktedonobacterales bacterium]
MKRHEGKKKMAENSGNISGEPTQSVIDSPWVRAFFSWISVICLVLGVPAFLAPKILPHMIGMEVSSICLDAMTIFIVLIFPALEVILWKLGHELPKRGYWGLRFLFLGTEIGLPMAMIIVFVTTYLPALSPPMPLTVIAIALTGVAFALLPLGLAIVFVDLIVQGVGRFRDRRRSLIRNDNEQ